jgi:signal recognition particle receptor subunit alpha
MIGVNGIGKTTTVAKIAWRLTQSNLRVGVAACDTFRSGAIEQLRTHAKRLNCTLFEDGYKREPASLGLHARKQKDYDVILCDTAGRMTKNSNLMQQLEKFVRVVRPDFIVALGEAQAGTDFLQQILDFETCVKRARDVGIDALCVTKLDTVEKGVGSILSVGHLTQKPFLFLGNGQTYSDLIPCSPQILINTLFSRVFMRNCSRKSCNLVDKAREKKKPTTQVIQRHVLHK